MSTKYKLYYQKMIDENKDIFDSFTRLHFDYSTDNDAFQDEFNKQGEKIRAIINEYENRLCRTSEHAGYSNYTGNLAEKFQNEVRSHFPLIDHIGIITKKTDSQSAFSIKKINLDGQK